MFGLESELKLAPCRVSILEIGVMIERGGCRRWLLMQPGRAGWETEAQLMIERNRKLIQLRARLLMALLRNRNTWN